MDSDHPRETLPQRYPPSATSKTTPTPTLFHSFPIPPSAPYNHNYNNHAYNTNPLNSGNLYMHNAASASTSSLLHSGRPLPTPPTTASPFAMSPPPPPPQAATGSTGTSGKVVHVGHVPAWKPKLELESMDTSPFSESFSAMFDDGDTLEIDTSTWVPEKSFNIERYADPKDLDPSWKDDSDISEILVISPKPTIRRRASNLSTANPKLPIIPEYAPGVNHAKYQSFDESIKLADFEFLPTPSPTRRANNPLPSSLSRMSSRAKLTSHICAYRRPGGVLQYNGLYTVKRRAHAHAQVNSSSAWREMDVMHILSGSCPGAGMRGDVPFVEKMYGTFIDNKNIYLVLGHHTRGTLADLVETHGPLNETTTKAYACELLCALEAIAQLGVVHNDICPDNIRIDASRHLVLVNFEAADLPGESSIQPDLDSEYTGTAERNRESVYKAPEVLLGWTRDSAVDVWGFGMVLYWMVTGQHPFLGGDECESLREAELEGKILHGPLLLDNIEESCHEAKGLIAKCLERNPAIRIRTGQLKGEAYFSHADWERITTRKVPILSFNHKRKQTGGATSRRKASIDGDVKVAAFDTPPLEPAPLISEGNRKRAAPDMFTSFSNPSFSANAALPIIKADGEVPESRVENAQVKEDASSPPPPGALDPTATAEEYIEEVEISREHPPEMYGKELTPQERMALFWESLDSEEVMTQMHQSTTALGIIGVGGGANGSPRPRKLRKKSKSMRTLTHRISTFSLTGQTPNKLRKKNVRKMASEAHLLAHESEARISGGTEGDGDRDEGIVVEPMKIPNLPQGVEQIGHGIGFTYGLSNAAKSKASICTDKSAPGWKRHMRLLPGGIGRGIRGVRHRLSMGKMNGNSGQQAKMHGKGDDCRPRDGMEYARGGAVDYNRGLGIGMEYGNSNAVGGCCYSSPATDDEPLTPDSLVFGCGTERATEAKIEGEFGGERVGPRMATLRLVPSTPQEDCDDDLDRIQGLY